MIIIHNLLLHSLKTIEMTFYLVLRICETPSEDFPGYTSPSTALTWACLGKVNFELTETNDTTRICLAFIIWRYSRLIAEALKKGHREINYFRLTCQIDGTRLMNSHVNMMQTVRWLRHTNRIGKTRVGRTKSTLRAF